MLIIGTLMCLYFYGLENESFIVSSVRKPYTIDISGILGAMKNSINKDESKCFDQVK